MIKEFQLRLLPRDAYNEQSIAEYLSRQENLSTNRITAVRVLKRSIDARQRQVVVNIKARVFIDEQPDDLVYTPTEYKDVSTCPPVVVVGAGPAGLFAALRLIELGRRPIVVERGKNVHDRKRDLAQISRTHTINPDSNYSFGEGGAGAYSDGKLYTRSKKRGSVEKILNVFCQHGASVNILADAHPHIGTDRLPRVIENIRNTIVNCGGEVHFQTKMTSLIIKDNKVVGINAQRTLSSSTPQHVVFLGPVILATGHSARDVYQYFSQAGIAVEAKGIAVGVRLEHPSKLIDSIQYHSKEGRGRWLPAAEYSYVTQVAGRGVYSFCMCPGGFVVPAATESEQIVVNGMSPASRGGAWSNSGMVVELHPEDIAGDDDLRVMHYQSMIEHACWSAAGGCQTAPAQRMTDFMRGRISDTLPPTSYAPGIFSAQVHAILPQTVSDRLRAAFDVFGKHSRGFVTNEAIVIAPETRTSSPVRILRDSLLLSHPPLSGLYPCGEGAGYAGGIVSAAIDGERCAERVAELT